MSLSQTPPPSPLPPLAPPVLSRDVDELDIDPPNRDARQKNLATGATTKKKRQRENNGKHLPGEKKRKRQKRKLETEVPTVSDGRKKTENPLSMEDVAASIPETAEDKALIKTQVKPERIHAGTSRSGEIQLGFDHESFKKKDAQLLLQQKHSELVNNGYTTLIGRVAKDVACGTSNIYKNKNKAATITFTNPYGNDIIVPGCGTYEDIIKNMHDKGECSARTAFHILKNLSKGYEKRDPQNLERKIEISDYELFSDLKFSDQVPEKKDKEKDNAVKLVAVLICEAIRFQEDGALARMAIRKVLSLFPEPSIPSVSTISATASSFSTTEGPVATNYSDVQPSGALEDNPFYKVFVLDEDTQLDEATPLAIFAAERGKARKIALIEGKSSGKHYASDQETLLYTADYLSDSEEQKKKKKLDEKKDDDTEIDVGQAKSQSPSNLDEEEKNPKKVETQTVLESSYTPDGKNKGGHNLRIKINTPSRFRRTPNSPKKVIRPLRKMKPRELFSKEDKKMKNKKNRKPKRFS